MCLPGDFHDKTDRHTGIFIRSAEGIHNKEPFARELILGKLFYGSPDLLAHRMIVIFIAFRGPPDRVFGVFIHDDIFVLRRTAGIYSGHNIDCSEFGKDTFIKAFQFRLHFLFKQEFVGRVMDDFRRTGNTVFFKIEFRHYVPLSIHCFVYGISIFLVLFSPRIM